MHASWWDTLSGPIGGGYVAPTKKGPSGIPADDGRLSPEKQREHDLREEATDLKGREPLPTKKR